MKISFVFPCYNEENNVNELYKRTISVIQPLAIDYEIIFVDDGSTDRTLEYLEQLGSSDDRVKVIELSRNFGHQAAISAGIDYSNGDALIMMDTDLQHPPELIPALIEKWKEGFEIVYTVRQDPEDIPFLKKITAKMFYRIINGLSRANIPENASDFRLIDKKVIFELRSLKEKNKFIRGLVNWVGFTKISLHYRADYRHSGKSKYTLTKMMKFAFDGITSFSSFPLHISTFLGLIVSSISFIYLLYALYIRVFTAEAIAGWTSVLVTILFLGGVQLLSLGVIGEYLNRVYEETKSRPSYIVRNIYEKKNT